MGEAVLRSRRLKASYYAYIIFLTILDCVVHVEPLFPLCFAGWLRFGVLAKCRKWLKDTTKTAGGRLRRLQALGSGSFGPKWEIGLSSSGDRAEETKTEPIHATFILCS
jgi:hypothetical protein